MKFVRKRGGRSQRAEIYFENGAPKRFFPEEKQARKKKATVDMKTPVGRLLTHATKVHLNLSQELIVTTEDKVRLCLQNHLQYTGEKRGWIAPLGILLTVTVSLVTTTFKDVGLSAYTWQALFIIIGILSFMWLVWCTYQATKVKTIEDLVRELKKPT